MNETTRSHESPEGDPQKPEEALGERMTGLQQELFSKDTSCNVEGQKTGDRLRRLKSGKAHSVINLRKLQFEGGMTSHLSKAFAICLRAAMFEQKVREIELFFKSRPLEERNRRCRFLVMLLCKCLKRYLSYLAFSMSSAPGVSIVVLPFSARDINHPPRPPFSCAFFAMPITPLTQLIGGVGLPRLPSASFPSLSLQTPSS